MYVQEVIKKIHERTRKVNTGKFSPTHYVCLNTQRVFQMWKHTKLFITRVKTWTAPILHGNLYIHSRQSSMYTGLRHLGMCMRELWDPLVETFSTFWAQVRICEPCLWSMKYVEAQWIANGPAMQDYVLAADKPNWSQTAVLRQCVELSHILYFFK